MTQQPQPSPAPADTPPPTPPPPSVLPTSSPAPVIGAPRPQPTMLEIKTGPGLLVRAIWFIFVGWWLTGIVSAVAWVLMITIIGLPLGVWLINRIPTVITLRPRTEVLYSYTDERGFARTTTMQVQQTAWWIRVLWFVFVGWWASAAVMLVGYVLVLLLITLPIGLVLYNRVPFVASLYRY